MIDELKVFEEKMMKDENYKAAKEKALAEAGDEIVKLVTMSLHNIKARPAGYWNNTGVYVQEGLIFQISYVSGSWKPNPYWGPTDGAGDSRYIAPAGYLLPGVPEGCLVGKVGGNNSGGGSPVFAVGNHGYVPPNFKGLLWLSVNDAPVGFGDNKGSINVKINPVIS